MAQKVTAIIERSSTGLCSIYTKEEFEKFGLHGYGDTPSEAIEDFWESHREMREMHGAEQVPDIDVTFRYDLSSFLASFRKKFSLMGLQEITGINAKQLNHYLSGYRNPSEKTVRRIEEAIHAFGAQLTDISLVVPEHED